MEIVLLSLLISFLALDTTVAFQVLISSPLFACTILGWFMGKVTLGLEMGFLFQLLWLGKIPAGAANIPEGNLASMIGAALVLLNSDNAFPNSTLALVFLTSIVISYLGAKITVRYRKLNVRILDVILSQVRREKFRLIFMIELGSIFLYFIFMFLLTFVSIEVLHNLLPVWIHFVGKFFEEQLIVVKPTMLGIGMAMILPLLRDAVRKPEAKGL